MCEEAGSTAARPGSSTRCRVALTPTRCPAPSTTSGLLRGQRAHALRRVGVGWGAFREEAQEAQEQA